MGTNYKFFEDKTRFVRLHLTIVKGIIFRRLMSFPYNIGVQDVYFVLGCNSDSIRVDSRYK